MNSATDRSGAVGGGPRILVATGDRELRHELTDPLQTYGYEVVTSRTAAYSLASVDVAAPSVAVLDQQLPDMSGAELCRRLQQAPAVGPGTPILLALPEHPDADTRRDALRSGAWSVLSRPIDSEEFLQKIQNYTEVRFQRERAALEGLVDPVTGFYNRKGLARWARELGALAFRRRAAFACLAIAPVPSPSDDPANEDHATLQVAEVLRNVRRGGDVIGRLERGEFVVLAPETSAVGALHYAVRLSDASKASPGGPALRIRYRSVENAYKTPIDALEMVGRASASLRKAQSTPVSPWIAPFESQAR